MKRYAMVLLLAVLWMPSGCGSSQPPPAPEMTDEIRKEIEEHDAQVHELESRQQQ